MRLGNVDRITDEKFFNPILRKYFKNKYEQAAEDPKLKDNNDIDSINILTRIQISKIMKLNRIGFKIVMLAYFSGLLWYIFLNYSENYNLTPDITKEIDR